MSASGYPGCVSLPFLLAALIASCAVAAIAVADPEGGNPDAGCNVNDAIEDCERERGSFGWTCSTKNVGDVVLEVLLSKRKACEADGGSWDDGSRMCTRCGNGCGGDDPANGGADDTAAGASAMCEPSFQYIRGSLGALSRQISTYREEERNCCDGIKDIYTGDLLTKGGQGSDAIKTLLGSITCADHIGALRKLVANLYEALHNAFLSTTEKHETWKHKLPQLARESEEASTELGALKSDHFRANWCDGLLKELRAVNKEFCEKTVPKEEDPLAEEGGEDPMQWCDNLAKQMEGLKDNWCGELLDGVEKIGTSRRTLSNGDMEGFSFTAVQESRICEEKEENTSKQSHQ